MNPSITNSKYDSSVKAEDFRLRETHLSGKHKQSDEENEQWHGAHGFQIFKNTWPEGEHTET